MLSIMYSGFAQVSIKKSSIDSGGTSVTSGDISMTYTIGEIAVREIRNNTIHISEGFLSAKHQIALGVKNFSPLEEVKIFPNPTVNFVNIHLPSQSNYDIVVTSIKGVKLTKYSLVNTNEYSLNMSGYQNGVYLILITDILNHSSKIYKIVKE